MINWSKAVLITFGEDQHCGEGHRDTVKCYHCGFTMVVKPYMSPSQCKGCMQFICDVCEGKRELGDPCYPEEQRLADFEKAVGRGVEFHTASRILAR